MTAAKGKGRHAKPGTAPVGKRAIPADRIADVSAPTATITQTPANSGTTRGQMSGRKPTTAQLQPPAQDAGNPKPA